jgi:phospholipid/cholesterol/gamma-HCH transport system substrate-binding protein
VKGRDEIIVGATMLLALAVVTAGAVWMSQNPFSQNGSIQAARFLTVGGLQVGNPVVLRGVRVGRVQAIELSDEDWVVASLQIYPDFGGGMPENPAVIAASASLFGEWQAGIIGFEDEIDDPTVRRDLDLAAEGATMWPGATLPDIGELTAQAGRIAGDIASFSARIETAFDDEVVTNLQRSIRDFSSTADQINAFAGQQTEILGNVAADFEATSGAVSQTAIALERTMARIDSATAAGQLDTVMTNSAAITKDLRVAADDFRSFMSAVGNQEENLARIVGNADSLFNRLEQGDGTIGRLVADSMLYVETRAAISEFRLLMADIKENPRKYFSFSVF